MTTAMVAAAMVMILNMDCPLVWNRIGRSHAGRTGLSAFLDMARVHPDEFPDVTVEVVEAASIHEAVVHRLLRFRSTRLQRRVRKLINFRPASCRQTGEDFRRLGGVRDVLLGELLELVVRQQ